MNRRLFMGRTALGVVSLLALAVTGCGWVSDVESVIPAALDALSQILAMISNANVVLGSNVMNIIGQIQSGGASLVAALKQYTTQNAATLIPEIEAGLASFLDNFQSLLSLLGPLPDTIINLVGAGVEVILSTIEGYIMNEPMPAAAQARLLAKLGTLKGKQLRSTSGAIRIIDFTAKKRSHHAFAHDFNAVEPKQYHIKEPLL